MATGGGGARRGRRPTAAAAAAPADPRQRLHACIASLTQSGQPSLDAAAVRELKQLCRADDQLVDLAYALLQHRLAEPHAQVRYSAFQIVDQLFRRSARFRDLTLDRFERLVDSVLIANEAVTPAPRPVAVFRQLGDLALEAFIDWHEQFSREQPKLVFAFRYLSEAHSSRLRRVRDRLAQTAAERLAEARQLAAKKRDLLSDACRQFAEDEAELTACLATVANCLSLLVPSPAEFDVNPLTSNDVVGDIIDDADVADDDDDDATTEDERRRLHGIVGSTVAGGIGVVALRLCRPCIRETPDNADLLEALVTRADQLRRRLRPRLARWLAVVERCGEGEGESTPPLRRQRLADLLAEADRLVGQVQQLRIVRSGEATASATMTDSEGDGEAESTGDFELVDKAGFETEAATPTVVAARPLTTASTTSTSTTAPASTSVSASLPSTSVSASTSDSASTWVSASTSDSASTWVSASTSDSASTSVSTSVPASTSVSASTSVPASTSAVGIAPVVPFGVDLLHWGTAGIATVGYRMDDGGHALGYRPVEGDTAFEISGSRDMLSMRTMHYATRDEPVRRACRHPLPGEGGGLCGRMDRVKCPFHGPIVPRDESGRPAEAAAARPSTPPPPSPPQKKKPRLRRSRRAVDGATADDDGDSASAVSGGVGLVDIRALEDTSRSRLAARVASRAALRRVAEVEAARQRRRMQEKFGDHFQYQFFN